MNLRRFFLLPIIGLVTASLAGYACSATGGGSQFNTGGAGGSGGTAAGLGGSASSSAESSSSDGLFDAGPGASSGSGGGGPGCSQESQYVYTLDESNRLFKFDPPTLTFTLIGTLNCPSAALPYSMGVSRDAVAWVIYSDGHLFQVDTKTANCKSTAFVPGQSGFLSFGMGFSTNAPGSQDETLYVSESTAGSGTTKGLAKIDLKTMTLTPIGMYDKVTARAEMTGTGDAKLFGAFEGMPYQVDEISKTDAKILSVAPQAGISAPPGSSNFAFAFWGGSFYLFFGNGTYTDVWKFDPKIQSTNDVKKNVTLNGQPVIIVGAGVSTCAPTKPPA